MIAYQWPWKFACYARKKQNRAEFYAIERQHGNSCIVIAWVEIQIYSCMYFPDQRLAIENHIISFLRFKYNLEHLGCTQILICCHSQLTV